MRLILGFYEGGIHAVPPNFLNWDFFAKNTYLGVFKAPNQISRASF